MGTGARASQAVIQATEVTQPGRGHPAWQSSPGVRRSLSQAKVTSLAQPLLLPWPSLSHCGCPQVTRWRSLGVRRSPGVQRSPAGWQDPSPAPRTGTNPAVAGPWPGNSPVSRACPSPPRPVRPPREVAVPRHRCAMGRGPVGQAQLTGSGPPASTGHCVTDTAPLAGQACAWPTGGQSSPETPVWPSAVAVAVAGPAQHASLCSAAAAEVGGRGGRAAVGVGGEQQGTWRPSGSGSLVL